MKHGEQIGEGEFKKVYEHESDPQKIHAELHESVSNEEIKSAFYIQKILKILFPDNVPDIHIAGNEGGEDPHLPLRDNTSYIVAEKIRLSEMEKKDALEYAEHHNGRRKLEYDELDAMRDRDHALKEEPAVVEFVKKAEDAGIEIDTGGQNFTVENGVAKYVEINPSWQKYPPSEGWRESGFRRFDEAKLKQTIENLPNGDEKEKAKLYFDRLLILDNEAAKKRP